MKINFSFDKEATAFKSDIKKIYLIALDEICVQKNIVVNLVFVSPEQIHEMNKKYRGVDRVTDVLSFPMLDNINELQNEIDYFTGEVEIGDIYINPQRAKEQAQEYGHSYRREVCFLALHGLLHLLGYDHIESEDEKVMFALQDKILDKANIRRD